MLWFVATAAHDSQGSARHSLDVWRVSCFDLRKDVYLRFTEWFRCLPQEASFDSLSTCGCWFQPTCKLCELLRCVALLKETSFAIQKAEHCLQEVFRLVTVSDQHLLEISVKPERIRAIVNFLDESSLVQFGHVNATTAGAGKRCVCRAG